MQVHQGDAAGYVLKLAAEVREGRTAPLDMVCVDAFDGNDDVPASLCSSGTKPGQLLKAQTICFFAHSIYVIAPLSAQSVRLPPKVLQTQMICAKLPAAAAGQSL